MSRDVTLSVTTLLLHACSAQDLLSTSTPVPDMTWNTSDTAAIIRRQLMDDNYSYLSPSEEMFPPRPSPSSPSPATLHRAVNLVLVPRARAAAPLQLLDPLHLAPRARAQAAAPLLGPLHHEQLDTNLIEHGTTTPATRYKILKSGGCGRRSGSRGRFLQEASADGVAVISLDRLPFPQFRLPAARRQYMETDQGADISLDIE